MLKIDPDPDTDDIEDGKYTILVRSTLLDSQSTTVETRLVIMLLPGEPGNYTIDEVDVIFYLPDVNVTDYSDFSFSITDDNYEVRGDAREFYDLTITVFLGTAAQFATFDVDTNTFEVQEAKLSHELNGRYQVDVVATLTDRLSSRTKVQVYHYFLTISVPEKVYTSVCEAGFVIGANCDED